MRSIRTLCAVAVLALAGCSPDSKHEILSKAEGVNTRAELEAAVGPPDERDKLGPLETWVYHASDGEVVFLITGDTVRLKATGD